MTKLQEFSIHIPSDSPLKFYWDIKTKKFERTFYESAMTEHKISFEKLDQFFTEADGIMNSGVQKVRKMYCMFLLAAVILLVCVITTVIRPTTGSLAERVFLLMAWMLVTAVFIGLVHKFIRKNYRKLKENIDNVSQNYLEVFEEQGYYWKFVMSYPGSLELVKGKRDEKDCTCLKQHQKKTTEVETQSDRQFSTYNW